MANKLYYQKLIIDLQAKIKQEQARSKSEKEYFDNLIRASTSASSKANYRKSKAEAAARHKANIESFKKQIARARLDKANAPK